MRIFIYWEVYKIRTKYIHVHVKVMSQNSIEAHRRSASINEILY